MHFLNVRETKIKGVFNFSTLCGSFSKNFKKIQDVNIFHDLLVFLSFLKKFNFVDAFAFGVILVLYVAIKTMGKLQSRKTAFGQLCMQF